MVTAMNPRKPFYRGCRPFLCFLLLISSLALQAQPAPALQFLVDPLPANQSFPAVFSIQTSPGSWGDFFLREITSTVVTIEVGLGCGFLCPGPDEYRHFPFDMPPLVPGHYTLNFIDHPDRLLASFPFQVSIGVSSAQPIRLYPEAPEAYSPFRIEILTGDSGADPYSRSATATIDEGVILIEHREPASVLHGVEASIVSGIEGLPPGDYSIKSVRRAANGTTVVEHEKEFSVADAAPETWVHMLYHPQLQHYFMTADEQEVNTIYWGPDPTFVSEWDYQRSDGFLAWPAGGPAPAAAAPVCRFYAKLVNSHFYTADEDECLHLQQHDSGWDYEGIAFQALVPSGGACAAGTAPVWRLFNDRAEQLDSNHRFTIHAGLYRALIHEGWLGEGVAFCSPIPEHGFSVQLAVEVSPAYPIAGQPVDAVLKGLSDHTPFGGPADIEIQTTLDDDILISASLNNYGYPAGSFYVKPVSLGLLAAGTYAISYTGYFGSEKVLLDKFQFTVFEDYPTVEAQTFHHTSINHYFVTAGADEAQGILMEGWHNTDSGFKVWSAAGPAPADAEPVCRFYSPLVNSHFYTASAEECDFLQSFNSGWTYEGIAFQALVPTQGVCPSGSQPVWRMFNNRHGFEDSNHRFVSSGETYRSMIAEGWAGEGIAFCSPLSD